jgi:hypothetical protein
MKSKMSQIVADHKQNFNEHNSVEQKFEISFNEATHN